MYDYSIGELESLVMKAYRGCGFSWGLAQEAGVAAGILAMSGLPSSLPFAQLLPEIDGLPSDRLAPINRRHCHWRGSGNFLCPVITGTVLSDFGAKSIPWGAELCIDSVLQPTIVLPFLSRFTRCVEVTIDECSFVCGDGNVVCTKGSPVPGGQPAVLRMKLLSDSVVAHSLRQRARVDNASQKLLLAFAHRTYVPATENSRLAGAGAGLLDND